MDRQNTILLHEKLMNNLLQVLDQTFGLFMDLFGYLKSEIPPEDEMNDLLDQLNDRLIEIMHNDDATENKMNNTVYIINELFMFGDLFGIDLPPVNHYSSEMNSSNMKQYQKKLKMLETKYKLYDNQLDYLEDEVFPILDI